jgi:hypothetical protein
MNFNSVLYPAIGGLGSIVGFEILGRLTWSLFFGGRFHFSFREHRAQSDFATPWWTVEPTVTREAGTRAGGMRPECLPVQF